MEAIEKGNLRYTGKAKNVYECNINGEFIIEYRDDLTALNGLKKGSFDEKGSLNNEISAIIFEYLNKKGVPTHFVKKLNKNESLVKEVEIVPLEVIIRNIAAGGFVAKYGAEKGALLDPIVLEFSYKNDAFNDPMINNYQILALKLATESQIKIISDLAFSINNHLKNIFNSIDVTLVDFKLEFGTLKDGTIVLADEVSPDTCRLWDKTTNKRLDKDLFRDGTGGFEDAYKEILRRLNACE